MSANWSAEPGTLPSDPVTVMITAIGGVGVGEQILKALTIVGGYRIVGTDMHAHCVNFSRVHEAYTLPRADDPDYVDAVLALAPSPALASCSPAANPSCGS